MDKLSKPVPMEIEWTDCAWNGSVYELDEMHKFDLIKLTTIGLGIEKEDRYVLVKEKMENETYRHITAIPKVNIVRVTLLRKK